MHFNLGIVHKIRQLLPSISICARIAIGNSIIIIIGALTGTIVSHTLTKKGEELALLLLIAGVGLIVSILLNYWIIRKALQPLSDLQRSMDRLQVGKPQNRPGDLSSSSIDLHNPDPQTCQIATTIDGLASQLDSSNRQLRSASRRAIHAHEEERKRIAGWLHDDTGQALVTLAIKLERIKNSYPKEDLKTRPLVDEAHQIAQHALDSLRKVITGMRPAILDDLGLIPAIRWYARSNLEEAGIRVHFQAPEEPLTLPGELSTTLFRIAQECINNIQRHSQARNAYIYLQCHPQEVSLCVEDDGQGFNLKSMENLDRQHLHWGLAGIQERVSLVDGTFELETQPGKGSSLKIKIPIPLSQEVVLG